MSFVKLDCAILRSTTWLDRPAREVFITALLLAEPREFSEPIPQLKVGVIEETGWVVPPGWYGFVPASGPGIVGAAVGLPHDEGMAALTRLGAPEPESRSQTFEGRRMVRIDGGYLILNYMKHREKDHTSPLRSARYRERLKVARETRTDTDTSRNHAVTSHTRVMPNRSAFCDLPSGSDPEGVQGEPKKPKRSKPRRVLPADFAPNAGHRSLALELGVSLDEEFPKFAEHHRYKGTLGADWDAGLRTWLRNARSFSGQRRASNRHPAYSQQQATQDHLAAMYREAVAKEAQ